MTAYKQTLSFRVFLFLLLMVPVQITLTAAQQSPQVSPAGEKCLDCHESITPAVVEQWRGSRHAAARVDCNSCHQANPGDPATFDHYGLKIAVIVTPNYCARCHAKQAKEFEGSHHADAAKFIGSLDNVLGEVV
jgi:hydroxylamine dehydrogenase